MTKKNNKENEHCNASEPFHHCRYIKTRHKELSVKLIDRNRRHIQNTDVFLKCHESGFYEKPFLKRENTNMALAPQPIKLPMSI